MYIGKVVGNVVSTKKEDSLTGYKLMIVELINRHEEPQKELVAVDPVGAGRGEFVLVATGSSARMVAGEKNSPIDATIVGIIDTFEK